MDPNVVTVTPRRVTASPVALAALALSETYRAEMESVRAARGGGAALAARQERMTDLAAKRAEAIRTALDEGMTQADVARVLGITAQAVHNVLRQH
jgi:DNA-directed RNA polymerase specialized sigma24 family protein